MSSSPSSSGGGTAFRLRRRIRDCAVALGSLGVVAFLITYALSTPSVQVELAVEGVTEHAGRKGVVHGRVLEAAGDSVADAEISLLRSGERITATRSGERGYFRMDVAGACAPYRIVVRAQDDGEPAEGGIEREVCPGDAVEVDARVLTDARFVWVPIR